MPTEILALAIGCLLLLVQIMAAAFSTTLKYGFSDAAGPRDEQKPAPSQLVERARRASANALEIVPIFATKLLAVVATGAWLYLIARIAYAPVYILGIPVIRSVIWPASLAGIMCVLAALFI